MKYDVFPTVLFVVEQAKAKNQDAIASIAEAAFRNERLKKPNDAASSKSWAELLYETGNGGVWQDVLRVILTTSFSRMEKIIQKERGPWLVDPQPTTAFAQTCLSLACEWKDACSLKLLLSHENAAPAFPHETNEGPNKVANPWFKELNLKLMTENNLGKKGKTVLPWHGWWRTSEKAWDDVSKARHFKEFLDAMSEVLEQAQNADVATFMQKQKEHFAAALYQKSGTLPATKAWLKRMGNPLGEPSDVSAWTWPLTEIVCESSEKAKTMASDLSVWFSPEVWERVKTDVNKKIPYRVLEDVRGLSFAFEHKQDVGAGIKRLSLSTEVCHQWCGEGLLKAEQTALAFEWSGLVERAARSWGKQTNEKYLPALLPLLQKIDGFIEQGVLEKSYSYSAGYKAAKSNLWAIERRVLMQAAERKTKIFSSKAQAL